MKVLLFGGSGMLGMELKPALEETGAHVVAPSHVECDLTDLTSIDRALESKPDFVINAAALINVDEIESDPSKAFAVNATATGHIAQRIAERGHKTPYLFVSTQYVFGDEKESYREDDPPSPLNKYGETKAEGERLVMRHMQGGTFYIVRTSWLYGAGETFVDGVIHMLQDNRPYLASEQRGNPTYTVHFADGIIEHFLKGKKDPGIYHLINFVDSERGVSRYEIAAEVARTLEKPLTLVEKATAEEVYKVPRPQHAALISTKLPPLPDWRLALKEYIGKRYGSRIAGGNPVQ